MGCVPLQLPLSRWARLWLTLLVGHLVITSKRSVAHRREKRRNDMTAEQLLSEIADYCRRVGMAESTFGRHAVNDGKLVSRLRIGGGVTMENLERVRTFMSEHRSIEARGLGRLRASGRKRP